MKISKEREQFLLNRIHSSTDYFTNKTLANEIIPFIEDMCIWGYCIGRKDEYEEIEQIYKEIKQRLK